MRANRAVLFDVDGTLIDAMAGQRRIWQEWAERFELDPSVVYETALRTRPVETVAELLPGRDPAPLVAVFDRFEDAEAAHGPLHAVDGAALLLSSLEPQTWALVTSNAERRVTARFRRLGLPVPDVIVDNTSTRRGKPSPDPYLLAAHRLGAHPSDCLVIEDAPSGVAAGIAAGMTTWSVNGEVPVAGAHRHFLTLAEATPDIVAFVAGRDGHAASA
ncbi:HAD family hydrolase [Agromyces fucosus]|uniref:HAD family hydrolase n=1 Tax=Agromyces fucosus TaxID=41985 RepID=A0A4Q2JJI8_9MICO|nr:HAD-IA family hydrolase [Agromyces fucosus]RXZ46716.1 HAD family hydrolase [Agromyces fucosus]